MDILAHVLLIVQAIASVGLILVGSVVEGYGYGLSLGTNWPYRRDIFGLAMRADPEAWHRIIATTLGVNALILAILLRDVNAISGLVLIASTALLGMATLNVLAGKAPAFLHGLHGLLAYGTLFSYLAELQPGTQSVWGLLATTPPFYPLLLMIFLGGMVTGQRGYQKPIGAFVVPRSKGQWVFAVHATVWGTLVLTLAYYTSSYSGALVLALLQALVGFMLYQSVNASPAKPGILTVFHQTTAMLIFLALVFAWQIPLPFLD
ncbi:MAG TPA: cytochrome C oxidase assembly protein [Spirochaetia bacterium]|nr:cytochrome C oxidase assembly protein [Spirochaetia bacterium]